MISEQITESGGIVKLWGLIQFQNFVGMEQLPTMTFIGPPYQIK